MSRASRWLPLFRDFIKDLRISSKEIVSDDPRGAPLVLWDSQKRFMDEVGQGLDEGIRVFNCLKSRQLGITTVSLAIDVFWLAMHNNLWGALVTDTEKNRDVSRATIRQFINSFPDGYFGARFSIVKGGDNRQFMKFSNGSRLDFLVAGTKKKSTAWGEGVGYAFAHLMELASYGDAAGLASFVESFAQVNPARLFIFESTAKGFNHWQARWKDGLAKPTERSFFIGWWASATNRIPRTDPRWDRFGTYAASGEERELVRAVAQLYAHVITPEQLAWIRWKESDAGAELGMLQQNQPWVSEQAFVLSGYSFFQSRQIGNDIKKLIDDETGFYVWYGYYYEYGNDFFSLTMRQIEDEAERDLVELKVWEEPVDAGRYVIGFDPAYGRNDHKDRSVISVWRCFADCIVQVAEYATAQADVKHAAWVCAHLAGAYNDCIVNLEIGGPGRMIMQEWEHLRGMLNAEMYAEKVRSRNWENALHQARWYLYSRPDSMGRGYAYNFETTMSTKGPLMFQYRGAYITKELVIRSRRLYEEMAIVVQDGAEIGAPESTAEDSKDDRVFAAALATRAWINWRRPEMIAAAQTYDAVMSVERGDMKPLAHGLNSIVARFFKTVDQHQAEQAEARREPKWLTDRGLA